MGIRAPFCKTLNTYYEKMICTPEIIQLEYITTEKGDAKSDVGCTVRRV